MDGQIVDFKHLPTKGYNYPEDMEIYIIPISFLEQIDMDRYGITTAEYFQIVLDGITVKGGFDKSNLLYADVQFMDIVRRLYSFDTNERIRIKDVNCMHRDCSAKFDYDFAIDEIEFTDFNPDIFGKRFVLGEGTDKELAVKVSPLTISEFISMSKRLRNLTDKKNSLSAVFLEYCCSCIREIEDREFKDSQARNSFLKKYIGGLTSNADKRIVKSIEDETVVQVKPFKVLCEECGRETEVLVTPSSNFQQ